MGSSGEERRRAEAVYERAREIQRSKLTERAKRIRGVLKEVRDPGSTLNGVLEDWFVDDVESLLREHEARFGL